MAWRWTLVLQRPQQSACGWVCVSCQSRAKASKDRYYEVGALKRIAILKLDNLSEEIGQIAELQQREDLRDYWSLRTHGGLDPAPPLIGAGLGQLRIS